MRLHITLNDDIVAQVDARAGRRGRSRYIVEAVRRRLEDERRWDALMAAAGSVSDEGHDWDLDPAAWVAEQRLSDPARVG
jgi:plasmid stability protein